MFLLCPQIPLRTLLDCSWALFWAVLGTFGAALGHSWVALGRSWALLGHSWGTLWPPWACPWTLLGRSGGVLGILLADFGRSWPNFCLPGASQSTPETVFRLIFARISYRNRVVPLFPCIPRSGSLVSCIWFPGLGSWFPGPLGWFPGFPTLGFPDFLGSPGFPPPPRSPCSPGFPSYLRLPGTLAP